MSFSAPTVDKEDDSTADEEKIEQKEVAEKGRESTSLVVTMIETATADQVTAAAKATKKWSEKKSKGDVSQWASSIEAGPLSTPYAGDTIARRSISFHVFPDVAESASVVAITALRVAAIDHVNSVWIRGDDAAIEVMEAASISTVYTAVHAQKLLPKGVDFATSDGRVRITERPGQLSAAGVHAIVKIAVAYLRADIALTASKAGPSAPSLFFNHVTGDEARAIGATLSAPNMAAANRGIYIVPFAIRSNEPDDLGGTFGSVAE